MVAGYAAGVSIEVKDEKMTNRSRKIKFFLDKMKAQENQTDSVAKLVKDLIVRKAITWVKAAAPIVGLVLLLLVLVVATIAVPVIAAIAILYNSPFAFFHTFIIHIYKLSKVISGMLIHFRIHIPVKLLHISTRYCLHGIS